MRGLAFRPDTNDMREPPASPILEDLLRERAIVKAHDPVANQEARKIFPCGSIEFCETLAQALDNAEAIVLVTRWEAFRKLPEVLRGHSPQPVFIDGRRMLDKRAIAKYEGIGL